MTSFFAELKRRHIYRVGAAYVVVAWALTQVIDILSQVFELPSWFAQPAVAIIVIGFPVALIAAWMIESKPHEAVAAAVRSKTTIVDWTLCGALIVVIAVVSYQKVAPVSGARRAQQGSVAQTTGPTPQPGSISIAVLPFVNLSSDKEQEFFSDGMTEEITSALANVSGLRVIGRTSAFQFKGQNQDLRAIGQALSAAYLIEGSVRKAGDQVRITAQLIKTDDGTHLWTENYDRQLSNIFAMQEDIAQAIAGALRVPLGLSPGERLVSNRTNDVESYQQYLRARALYRARAIDAAITVLEPAVKRDPNYAPAQALLAQVYVRAPTFNPTLLGSAQSLVGKAETAAREAIRQDPKNSGGYAGLALVYAYRGGHWTAADDLFQQALALDGNDADTLHAYSNMLADTGRVQESLALRKQLRTLEPFVPVYNLVTARVMLAAGDRFSAIQILEAIPPDAGAVYSFGKAFLAEAYAAVGRYGDAADALLATPPNLLSNRQSLEDAARLLRSATAKGSAANALPALEGTSANFYLYSSAPDRALEYAEDLVRLKFTSSTQFTVYWAPEYASVRKTERFKAVVRAWGFPEYWGARGWPKFCRPTGIDDFECE